MGAYSIVVTENRVRFEDQHREHLPDVTKGQAISRYKEVKEEAEDRGNGGQIVLVELPAWKFIRRERLEEWEDFG